jgi:hypothetical protein
VCHVDELWAKFTTMYLHSKSFTVPSISVNLQLRETWSSYALKSHGQRTRIRVRVRTRTRCVAPVAPVARSRRGGGRCRSLLLLSAPYHFQGREATRRYAR